jgi:hypothetical protein
MALYTSPNLTCFRSHVLFFFFFGTVTMGDMRMLVNNTNVCTWSLNLVLSFLFKNVTLNLVFSFFSHSCQQHATVSPIENPNPNQTLTKILLDLQLSFCTYCNKTPLRSCALLLAMYTPCQFSIIFLKVWSTYYEMGRS